LKGLIKCGEQCLDVFVSHLLSASRRLFILLTKAKLSLVKEERLGT